MKTPPVTVYSTPSCPFCKMAKEFLSKNGVDFNDVNVASDQKAAAEMIEKSGQMGVPVVEIGKKVIIGFDKEAIAKELRI